VAEPVTIARAAPVCLVAARVRADDAPARDAVAGALGLSLPDGPASPSVSGSARLFWIAPDRYWFVRSDGNGPHEAARLHAALRGHHVSILDISDSRTVFTVAGSGSRALLVGGTGIDLHPRVFRRGSAALTRFAALSVLLTQVEETPSFELFADRAAEEYLAEWFSTGVRQL
jgi:sarcosine oxidase subunit gamma